MRTQFFPEKLDILTEEEDAELNRLLQKIFKSKKLDLYIVKYGWIEKKDNKLIIELEKGGLR